MISGSFPQSTEKVPLFPKRLKPKTRSESPLHSFLTYWSRWLLSRLLSGCSLPPWSAHVWGLAAIPMPATSHSGSQGRCELLQPVVQGLPLKGRRWRLPQTPAWEHSACVSVRGYQRKRRGMLGIVEAMMFCRNCLGTHPSVRPSE